MDNKANSKPNTSHNPEVEITRLEVINHANAKNKTGRLLVLYKMLGDFNSIELSYQDGGQTLKIFLD